MSKRQTGPNMQQLQAAFDTYKKALPAKAANKARNFFTQSWARQGFLGSNGLERWQPRKQEGKSTGRATLVQTGALRRSLMATHGASFTKVAVVGPAKKYAGIHNTGGTINNPGGQPYIVLPADKVKSPMLKRKFGVKGGKVIVFLKRNRGSFPKNVRYTKPFSFTMPKRQFIGNSTVLNRQLLVMVNKDLRALIK